MDSLRPRKQVAKQVSIAYTRLAAGSSCASPSHASLAVGEATPAFPLVSGVRLRRGRDPARDCQADRATSCAVRRCCSAWALHALQETTASVTSAVLIALRDLASAWCAINTDQCYGADGPNSAAGSSGLRRDSCAYGATPGRWQQTAPDAMQWQAFAPECQLTDRLTEYGVKLGVDPAGGAGNATNPARILFYGDSVDRTMVCATSVHKGMAAVAGGMQTRAIQCLHGLTSAGARHTAGDTVFAC